jgi:ribosomal-protein-alanine N-acetyltransferase
MTRTPNSPRAPGASPEQPPALTTPHLRLPVWPRADLAAVVAGDRRPHWAADFPADGDREIAGHLAAVPGAPVPDGQRLLVERATGLVVGAAGLFPPDEAGVVAFGYGVVPSRRGRGYATEAARALVEHALTLPGVTAVRAEAERANPASVRVLEKAGLPYAGDEGTRVVHELAVPGMH